MTLVKICGLRDPETAVATAKAGADFIGLMFAESRRQVTPQQCHDIVEALHELRKEPEPARFDAPQRGDVPARAWFGAWSEVIEDSLPRYRPLIVGVFADQPLEDVNNIANAAGIDIVQLSGGESWEFASHVELPVVRACHVGPQSSADDVLDTIEAGIAAGLLLDTAKDGARGGTGTTFDWDVAAEVARRHPFFLAGGLNPENVGEAIAQVSPWAVDVSSGVETGGVKDIEKIRAFIRAAKGTRS